MQTRTANQSHITSTAPHVSAHAALGLFGSSALAGASMHFERNSEIYGEGEPADYVYKVLSGTVRTSKVLTDGRRQIGSFYLPGDTFGLEAHPFSFSHDAGAG